MCPVFPGAAAGAGDTVVAGVTRVPGVFAENKLRYEIVMYATLVSGGESTVLGLTAWELHPCDSQHVVLYESVGH